MDQTFDLGAQLVQTYQHALSSAVGAIPRVVTGIVLTVIAVIVARVIERVLRAMLLRVRFDDILGRAGIDKTLQRIGFRQSLSFSVPRMVYFLLLDVTNSASIQAAAYTYNKVDEKITTNFAKTRLRKSTSFAPAK